MTGEQPRGIFISHAVRDRDLSVALTELLQLGADVSAEQIFNVSLEETGIPKGKNFVQVIHEALGGAQLVVQLVTPSFLESRFCLCELGAQWMLGLDAFPLVVPPVTFGDLDAVLAGVQAGRINEPKDLDDLFDRVNRVTGKSPATAGWTRQKAAFILKLETLLADLSPPTMVTAEKFQASQDVATGLQERVDALQVDLGNKERIIEKLAAAKDREEVMTILVPEDDEEAFAAAVQELRRACGPLPPAAVSALKEFAGNRAFVPEFGDDGVDRASAEGFLQRWEDSDGWHWDLTDDPKVERVKAAIEALNSLELSEEFEEAFLAEHGMRFDLANVRVWRALEVR